MARFVLTKEADKDLEEISYYTVNKWGAAQRNKYLWQLINRLRELANTPTLGLKCPELYNTPFKYHEGRHLIFYRPIKGGIEVIRVLHEAMDIPKHFKP